MGSINIYLMGLAGRNKKVMLMGYVAIEKFKIGSYSSFYGFGNM